MSLTGPEIVGMCEKLANRFNSPSHRDDMVQEGVLKCYEILSDDEEVHPAHLYREAKRRMHDYLNIDVLPVTVPAHNITRRLTRDIDDDEIGEMSEAGHKWLKVVLSSTSGQYNEEYGGSGKDHVERYETRDFAKHVIKTAREKLTTEELEVVKLRYFGDMTQEDVANAMGKNKMWVSRYENSAMQKLRKSVL
jgi:RNA polymerase sigma factor (sigma-70 family)